MLFYLNFRIIDPIISKLIKTRWKKISEYFHVFSLFKTRHLFKVFLFSLSRYLVFSLQFVILVRAFGVAIPYPEGLMLVALMFFVMTAIPTITLAELGIRGSVTIFLFGLYYQEAFSASRELAVFAASSLLWFINLAIPALIGSVFVFSLNFFQKIMYHDHSRHPDTADICLDYPASYGRMEQPKIAAIRSAME